MKRGQTTFVDATHLFKRAFTMYNKLRNKYGYKVYLIDCMNPYMQIAKLKGLDEQQTRDYLVTELIRHNGSRRNTNYAGFSFKTSIFDDIFVHFKININIINTSYIPTI